MREPRSTSGVCQDTITWPTRRDSMFRVCRDSPHGRGGSKLSADVRYMQRGAAASGGQRSSRRALYRIVCLRSLHR